MAVSGIGSLLVCKNRHSPLSGGFNEAQVGLIITAFGRLYSFRNPESAGFSVPGNMADTPRSGATHKRGFLYLGTASLGRLRSFSERGYRISL